MISLEEYRKLPVKGAMSGAVGEAVYLAVDRAVGVTVDRAVNGVVTRGVSQDFNEGFKEPTSKLSPLVTIARILWGAITTWLRHLGGALVDR